MAVGSPTGGPNDVVQNNVLFIYYGVAGKGDLSPGFPCLLLESPVQHVQAIVTGFGVDASSLDPGTSFRFEGRGLRGSMSHSRLDRVPV